MNNQLFASSGGGGVHVGEAASSRAWYAQPADRQSSGLSILRRDYPLCAQFDVECCTGGARHGP